MAASLCNLSFFSSPVMMKKSNAGRVKLSSFSNSSLLKRKDYRGFTVKAFFLNPMDEPLIKEALKEPVAFMGGMFAGLLRLDLNEDPLKEWVARTVEATGMTGEEIDSEGSKSEEEAPQEIVIE